MNHLRDRKIGRWEEWKTAWFSSNLRVNRSAYSSLICQIKAETEVSRESVCTLQNDYQRECWVSLGFRRFQVKWNFDSLLLVTSHGLGFLWELYGISIALLIQSFDPSLSTQLLPRYSLT